MDKSWLNKQRNSAEYVQGLKDFLEYAFKNKCFDGKILCPCEKCACTCWVNAKEAKVHLISDGMMKNYTCWVYHGEQSSHYTSINPNSMGVEEEVNDDMHEMLNDMQEAVQGIDPTNEDGGEGGADEAAHSFYNLLRDAEQELYPGCKMFTKLSFIVELFHIKCLCGWTNKSFNMLLELLKRAFPEGVLLPKNMYETKKIIRELGLHYDMIDACPNDCMLYWRETTNLSSCSKCGTSRWKTTENNTVNEGTNSCKKDKKIPAKVLRHFPLKGRLQMLFMSSKTSSYMRWHHEGRKDDSVLRHPADSPAWQDFDVQHEGFSLEPRNVRLGLASDGFNPFRSMNITHSTWPVILIPYNLPPWMCMKQPYMMMSLLIPGPHSPGNAIDVYLQPLIEELKELWVDGVDTYDHSRKETFRMRAALLWTISDFPAYAMLSGWSTKGEKACPCCNVDTRSQWLAHGKKFCYMGHRRFLPEDHKFRSNRIQFNGKQEWESPPRRLYGSDVLKQLQGLTFTLGKGQKRKRQEKSPRKKKLPKKKGSLGNENSPKKKKLPKFKNLLGTKKWVKKNSPWKKKSIFFELPYWKTLLLPHNLDVMHIERNVGDKVVGTLLNITGKTKDTEEARLDLEKMHLRPRDSFVMTRKQKKVFCQVLKRVKVPDGYAANISRCVNLESLKISGLKSHDFHVLMQQLLLLAIRTTLPKKVSSVLIDLCNFFRDLCSKVGTGEQFERLTSQIAVTLCCLETIFPPGFFDIMVHLPIHLAYEAKIAGPIHYRWMYPIERYLFTLKSYVRNRSRPEGSIAEGYLANECLTFCSRYLQSVETRFNRPLRNDDNRAHALEEEVWGVFKHTSRLFGGPVIDDLDEATLILAHRYVLNNCNEIDEYRLAHLDAIRDQHPRDQHWDIERIHNAEFPEWLKGYVRKLRDEGNDPVSENLRWVARGPSQRVKKYSGCLINGFRFHTKALERKRKTQNSGVVVVAKTPSYASRKDKNPIHEDKSYYGVLTEIIELDYYGSRKALLFKCEWADYHADRGIKKDPLGFTLVNLNHCRKDDPFVLASQVEQVFYVEDPTDKHWHVVRKTTPRDFFDTPEEDYRDDFEPVDESDAPCTDNLIDIWETSE
ncbi:uncharacterized protein LOC143869927 [Tasmannia lanceolata]|uniref:uncharacterized protein LOC143869927 n=1 Tax=Tasmannia lanceolata TaxID=3420 RepID=UPI0040643B16